MSDSKLRDLERSGDGVGLLRERMRAGQLTREHVELAASLGHAHARVVCPESELVTYADLSMEVQRATALLGETLPARLAAD